MRFWLAQPEVKYWFCEKFEGHFIGVHLHGAQYFGGFSDKRYDGYLAEEVSLTVMIGFFHRIGILKRAEIGVGYARLWYKEVPHTVCEVL